MRQISLSAVVFLSLMAHLVGGLSSDTANIIEVRVVVDNVAFSRWKTMTNNNVNAEAQSALEEFLKSMFIGANDIYKKLKDQENSNINLEARIAKFDYDKTVVTSAPSDRKIANTAILAAFKTWLGSNSSPADHYLLITGLNIVTGGEETVKGAAFTGKMCTADSLSAVELVPNGDGVHTMVHEMAHSLNSKHDDGEAGCTNSKNIMKATFADNTADIFQFSSCSVAAMTAFLEDEKSNCLRDTSSGSTAVNGKRLGQLYNPDEICQYSVKASSFFNRMDVDDYSKICTEIWCWKEKTEFVRVLGTDGFKCGQNKICSLGTCIDGGDPDAEENCPYGKMPKTFEFDNQYTCSVLSQYYDMPQARPTVCGNSYMKNGCCFKCD